jgi:hypothetical protein
MTSTDATSFMPANPYLARLIDISGLIQVPCFFLLLLFLAFGHVARWDVLDHVAMADRYSDGGRLYPDALAEHPGGVGVYFPGVSVVAYAIGKIIPSDFVVTALLSLAAAVTFLVIWMQREIAKSIDSTYQGECFWPIAILVSLFLLKPWLFYAIEFKPDSIAYLFGGSCVLQNLKYARSGRHQYVWSLAFGLLAGLALFFKQQYIAFVFGCALFAVQSRSVSSIVFAMGSIASSALVLFLIKQNSDAWFWTVTVLSDDGFLSARDWAIDHRSLAIKTAMSIFAFWIACRLKIVEGVGDSIARIALSRRSRPWVFVVLFGFLSAFLSSWKNGGNAGNTAYGMMLMLPFVVLILRHLNPRLLILLAWLIIGMQIPYVRNSARDYAQAQDLGQQVQSLQKVKTSTVLTGSDVYFATRRRFLPDEITNYWSIALRNNDGVDKGLADALRDNDYDYLVLENNAAVKTVLKSNPGYRIVYENPLGFVAVLLRE